MKKTERRPTLGTARIATLLLLASVLATSTAYSQNPAEEPPAFPGNQPVAGGETASGGETAPENNPITNVAYFKDQLAPYGQWVGHEGYGEVWVPKVEPTWRPYTNGRWANTDQGWGWVADEPWGWAPFHYGRWFYDRGVGGWAWVPGSDWAPAWVAWRHGGGYLGWAPLPPTAGFSAAAGLDLNGNEVSSGFFTFVAEGAILASQLSTVIVPTARNATIVHNTIDITNYTVVNNRIVNQGVDVHRIEQVTGHRVPRLQVAAMASSQNGGRKGAFYQPPALARQVGVPHAEFGKTFSAHAGAQQRSRVSAQPSANSGVASDRDHASHDAATRRGQQNRPAPEGSPSRAEQSQHWQESQEQQLRAQQVKAQEARSRQAQEAQQQQAREQHQARSQQQQQKSQPQDTKHKDKDKERKPPG